MLRSARYHELRAHQKSFEKALYAIQPNFPPGKTAGRPEFASVYYNMSQGGPELNGPWNSGEKWQVVSDRDQQFDVDGGGGDATVTLDAGDAELLNAMAARTMSNPAVDPLTGAELGMMADPGQIDSASALGGSVPSTPDGSAPKTGA